MTTTTRTATLRKAALATAGLAVVGGAVFGATEAFAASPSPAASTSASAGASASASSASGKAAAACKDAKHPARCALLRHDARARLELLRNGEHGQNTIKDAAGAIVVHEWQVGKVTSVNGSSVTVTSGDGTTWTWTVQSATAYRVDGAKGTLAGVHVGDTILVRGKQSGSTNEAGALLDPNQSKLASRLAAKAG